MSYLEVKIFFNLAFKYFVIWKKRERRKRSSNKK